MLLADKTFIVPHLTVLVYKLKLDLAQTSVSIISYRERKAKDWTNTHNQMNAEICTFLNANN